MKFAAKTDIGKKRERNEDSYRIISGTDKSAIFVVADGMGGHNSGEVASKLAVDYIADQINSNPDDFSESKVSTEIIADLMVNTNHYILENANKKMENAGMGTTLITAAKSNDKLFIGHVGDSRVYLIRQKEISQVTIDHSYIEELLKAGTISKEEAFKHPQRNIITRAVGITPDIEIDRYTVELLKDDIILICTDGLTNMLHDDEIKDLAINTPTAEKACDKLIEAAIGKGGEDNITVIIIKGI